MSHYRKNKTSVTVSEEGRLRHLHFSSPWIQGSMNKKAPLDLVHQYIQQMMAWGLFLDPKGAANYHVVQLGLGAASLTKFCALQLNMCTTAVEINPAVYRICVSSFALPAAHHNISIRLEDAMAFVKDAAHQSTVDVLQVDLYDRDAAAPMLCSPAFYQHCHQVLNHQGIMCVNVFGRHAQTSQTLAHIQSAFGHDKHVRQFRPTAEGNVVMIAMKSDAAISNELLHERAQWIEDHWKLPANQWIRQLHLVQEAPH